MSALILGMVTDAEHVTGGWKYTLAEQSSPLAESVIVGHEDRSVVVKFRDGRYLMAGLDERGNVVTRTYRLERRQ